MERSILLLFERPQLIIPRRQRHVLLFDHVFPPFIDSQRKNVVPSLFPSLFSRRKGHRGRGGGGWSQWKFKFQLFSSRREAVGTPASPLANRAATLTSTVSTKPNELEWRNTTSFPPYALSPPRFHVSFFISRRDHPLLPRCCAFFPLDTHYTPSGTGREGIIPPYRDPVNNPIRRRNRVSFEVGFGLRLVLYDLVQHTKPATRFIIRWSNFLKISFLALLRNLLDWKLFEGIRNGFELNLKQEEEEEERKF